MNESQLAWVPTDGGPIYKETILTDQFLIEPWNAISSLAIVLPAIYWAYQLRNKPFRNFLFMWYCIPLLILGGTGSTLFHGFRNSSFLLYLDVVPTAILTLSVGVLFWMKVTKNWIMTASIFIGSLTFRYFSLDWLPGHLATNISYFITGTLIFLPILIYLRQVDWFNLRTILYSVFFLILSLIFRSIDKQGLIGLPMGTHFLWHIASGIGGFYLAKFLYELQKIELKKSIIYE